MTYGTQDIATMLQVAPRTVTKWCNKGLLKHTKLPFSNFRRIEKSDLIAFIILHQLPMPEALLEQPVFGVKELRESLVKTFGADSGHVQVLDGLIK
jgi:hypothetical protein